MFKNQLQELAQKRGVDFPSYSSVRQGPEHQPSFKAAVIFNGARFESPQSFTSLRKAEQAAAEVAINALCNQGPTFSCDAKIIEETGAYKNLLQEASQKVGIREPIYTSIRSGSGHMPVFVSTVELAGMRFTGEQASNKKLAEKNAARTAWFALKQRVSQINSVLLLSDSAASGDEDRGMITRYLADLSKKSEPAEKETVRETPRQVLPPTANYIKIRPFTEGSNIQHEVPKHTTPASYIKVRPFTEGSNIQHEAPKHTTPASYIKIRPFTEGSNIQHEVPKHITPASHIKVRPFTESASNNEDRGMITSSLANISVKSEPAEKETARETPRQVLPPTANYINTTSFTEGSNIQHEAPKHIKVKSYIRVRPFAESSSLSGIQPTSTPSKESSSLPSLSKALSDLKM